MGNEGRKINQRNQSEKKTAYHTMLLAIQPRIGTWTLVLLSRMDRLKEIWDESFAHYFQLASRGTEGSVPEAFE